MTSLKPGDKAPEFEGVDANGAAVSSRDFIGRRLILYFYPKDNTPGCTAEACNLRDNYEALLINGFAVAGVSADPVKSHKSFSDKYKLPFPLIADVDKKIINAYGVWGPKKFMGKTFDGIIRTTFAVSEEGIIEHVFDKVETANHTAQILKAYGIKS
jgi:thioredoxin-dependent peroxiredoxin